MLLKVLIKEINQREYLLLLSSYTPAAALF